MFLRDFISLIRWAEDYCLEMVGIFEKNDINIAYTHCIETIKHIAFHSNFSKLSQKDYASLHLEFGYSLQKMRDYI